jgi:hypothetical protein
MSRRGRNIPHVARQPKGYDAQRTWRFPSRLKEPLALLARLTHRDVNDEIVIAVEERLARHKAEIDELRERERPTRRRRS